MKRLNFNQFEFRLINEIDEMKSLSTRYEDDITELHQKCNQYLKDLEAMNVKHDNLQKDIDDKDSRIQKYELDLQKQMDTVAHLNKEVFRILLKFYD